MSAQSISRWNAIPLSRPEPNEQDHAQITKRSRPDGEQDSDEDDNISIVSRTPSPPPEPMDTDASIAKYDEYVRGTPREVITVETKLKSSNKGFSMLAKLGWTEGQPLGLSGDGRVEPIPFQVKRDLTGLGKLSQDVRMIETTVSQRRGLDSERQRKETEEQRKARQDVVARREAVKTEISYVLRPFYCALCDKQFQNVAQYDEHTNSYAHHHKARLRDMQANSRIVPQEELDKRKEKERKREEKELRKLAKAAGIKMAKPPVTAGAAQTPAPTVAVEAATESKSTGFKKAGWASVAPVVESSGRRGGWAPANPPAPPPGAAPAPPAQAPDPTPPPPVPTNSQSHNNLNPSFRTAGWTSLDTGSSQPFPPAPPRHSPPQPLPPNVLPPPPPADIPSFSASSYTNTPPSLPPGSTTSAFSPALAKGGWASFHSGPPPPSPRGWNTVSAPLPPSTSIPVPPMADASGSQSLGAPVPPAAPPRQESKSGWQQWKQGSGGKRR